MLYRAPPAKVSPGKNQQSSNPNIAKIQPLFGISHFLNLVVVVKALTQQCQSFAIGTLDFESLPDQRNFRIDVCGIPCAASTPTVQS